MTHPTTRSTRVAASYLPERTPAPDAHVSHARAILTLLFGPAESRAFSVRYWNGAIDHAGSALPRFTVVVNHPGALRRMLLPPNELTIVEALLSGDVEIEGDAEGPMALGDAINDRLRSGRVLSALVRHLLALPRAGRALDVRAVRASRSVQRTAAVHAPERDQAAIRYHYDVGNEFYARWLDPRMVYSCAYFDTALGDDPAAQLERAQEEKLELICRKLRLSPGDRLLDVGCGWGALIMHATRFHGVQAVGITLSAAQGELARQRIAAAGLADRCTVELLDYRHLPPEWSFDKISSVGMVEHVGEPNLGVYFASLQRAMRPGGVLLNHGIVSIASARPAGRWDWLERRVWKRDAFIDQYVFPDGRLGPLHAVIAAAEGAGFETRDVESLREHYTLTLRCWQRSLEAAREEAIALTDERTYRTWRLYLAASAHGFDTGRIGIVQLLLAKPTHDGDAAIPLRRDYMRG